IDRHRGMFSLLGTSTEQVERLRRDHGIYLVSDGRINVAGLREDQIERFVAAVLATSDQQFAGS
ncbi:MAG: aminotransferase class I/II-fold pyridoxal phosphate-dependent enzyme, partial [Burkholderiaceae bacterium]|nr:aminotransferase class I/II-fold pyridoxal phosphate-dependent enzyme [Burkholderiaceae bacterium]